MQTQTDDLLITDTDLTAAEQAHLAEHIANKPAPPDPAKELENKVAPRVAEARLIKVVDQATLDAVSERRGIIKALQKEAESVFRPIKQKMDAAKKEVLDQEKRVMGPLEQEDSILRLAVDSFVIEQRRIAEEAERKQRLVREAEERRLLAAAEEARKLAEKELNERLQREHEEEVERVAQEAEAAGVSPELVSDIINTPAPEHVHIPLEIPELPPVAAPVVPVVTMPKGMSMRETYKATVTSLSLLCRAIAEGKVSSNYVEPNMSALNARARADGAAMDVPGVKVEKVTGSAQRAR